MSKKINALSSENIEINEHIKQYLKFNEFQNTLECFTAEINAQRMSSKLNQNKLLKDPENQTDAPRLYSMLKGENFKTFREKQLSDNYKVMSKKYEECLQASKCLFGLSVTILKEYEQTNEAKEQNIQQKILSMRLSILKFTKIVTESDNKPKNKALQAMEIRKIKENIKQEYNNKDYKEIQNILIKLRVNALETDFDHRKELCYSLVTEDILDLKLLIKEEQKNDKQNDNQNKEYQCYSLSLLNYPDHFLKHQLVALISIVLSTEEGRKELIDNDQNNNFFNTLIKQLKEQEEGSVSQRFYLAVIQKMSVYDKTALLLYENQIIKWCIDQLINSIQNKLHVFCLEYISALISNVISNNNVMLLIKEAKDTSLQFLKGLLKCLQDTFPLSTIKNILFSLSQFKIQYFNQQLLETLYDEKINQFLNSLTHHKEQLYKQEILNFHANIFLKEQNKKDFENEENLEIEKVNRMKEQQINSQIIFFEHFNDEVTYELTKF